MKPTVKLYDTTLRDGAQGEGIHFSLANKLAIARRLDAFGVHYIEGGWPGSNQKDIEFFEQAKSIRWAHAKIAAFGSTRRANVAVQDDPQVRLLLEAEAPVVTIFGKTWLLHVLEVLRTTPEENLAMIADTVRYLKSHGREVVYDAEHCFDGYKDSPDYAMACMQAAEAAGADYIVACDTNGGTLPRQTDHVIAAMRARLTTALGIHTHDDSGVAVANALAAVEQGATQVQGTINGFGERVGNCNLVTVMANLQLKMDRPVVPDASMRQLQDLAFFVDETANLRPNPRAPFVGQTAFAHKGGMHVNAVNKVARSFEHIEPQSVGNRQRVLVGELAGRTNVMLKARELNIPLEEKSDVTRDILNQVKALEAEGYEFEGADSSFELLMRKALQHHKNYFELLEYHVGIVNNPQYGYTDCEATIKLQVNGERFFEVAEGDGPVNALDAALRKALVRSYPGLEALRLTDYKVRILDSASGTAARTRVLIDSTDGTKSWTTVGVSDNIIEASWRALRDSVEYFLLKNEASTAAEPALTAAA
ncbi:citramalate synthase [Verrucomicrobia bacterium LW23]|nr:citramalate synthase [Verrucomicrobia bacterium LW23]